jgi:hypothetical protein
MNPYQIDIARLSLQGYCCSQIIVAMALELQGREDFDLVRAVAGLCHGFPNLHGPCGALSGAACLLGLYGGKGRPEEEEDERLPLMLAELESWFTERCTLRHGGISCKDITGNGEPDSEICGNLVADCYGQAMTLLVDNGFDPVYSHEQ